MHKTLIYVFLHSICSNAHTHLHTGLNLVWLAWWWKFSCGEVTTCAQLNVIPSCCWCVLPYRYCVLERHWKTCLGWRFVIFPTHTVSFQCVEVGGSQGLQRGNCSALKQAFVHSVWHLFIRSEGGYCRNAQPLCNVKLPWHHQSTVCFILSEVKTAAHCLYKIKQLCRIYQYLCP